MESLTQNQQQHRTLFLDQIKAIMIALVIASHTVLLAGLSSAGVGQLIKDAPFLRQSTFGLSGYAIHFS